MKRIWIAFMTLVLMIYAASGTKTPSVSKENVETERDTIMKMNVQIGEQSFTATLEDNAAVSRRYFPSRNNISVSL